ncbi:right-handed parallel beta-helix repeat-containing protein [Mesorhizobium sp.]|uniref:right-handed parallel beta-helix repeat-containing protein n=1 Tax=Mesorhizobium sp. TaxID=1871066 RepID=UPI0012104DA5|nr:right-handed parallel beta-helix repeat-containing protein [Mesorhizobium sp.]TIN11647.1 MAG: right-handed parallel beta-helix repeat-containing protein [Mesorhizobium sp.]
MTDITRRRAMAGLAPILIAGSGAPTQSIPRPDVSHSGEADEPIYDTVTKASTSAITAGIKEIRTRSFSLSEAAGADCLSGALYRRISKSAIDSIGYPSRAYLRSRDRYMPDGSIDDVEGGYWAIVGSEIETRQLGAVGDGRMDDTEAVKATLLTASVLHAVAIISPGIHLIKEALEPTAGLLVRGYGKKSVIKQSACDYPQVFTGNGVEDVSLSRMKLVPHSRGTDRNAVHITRGSRWLVEYVWIEDHTDANGVFMVDCDDCVVDRLYFDGGGSLNGYAVYMAGCKGCKALNSRAYRPEFGFVIAGKDIQPISHRTSGEAFGNLLHGCRVNGHGGHAYDINAAHGNIISNCVAEDYAGASTNVAFQVKDTSTGGARQNVFIGCVAKNVPNGFGGQSFGNAVFIGCRATEISGSAFFFNGGRRSQIKNCVASNFDTAAVQLSATSPHNIIDGLVIDTGNTAAKAILIDGSGSSANQFDHVQIVSTVAAAIDIASGANDNRFGIGFNANQMPITDASLTSIWPVVLWTPEIDASGIGSINGPVSVRGMQVARALFVITDSISGTPQAQCGYIGANTAVAAAQNITGSAGASVSLTLATAPTVATAGIMQGRIGTAGSAGAGFFQYEGLSLI